MDKEINPAEIIDIFPKTPEMFVIKGGRNEIVHLTMPLLYPQVKRFTGVKDTATIDIRLPLDKHLYRIIKRSIDIIFSSIAIITVLSWLVPLMAILIKLDSRGPVFFLQKRNKRNGNFFTCIKFRSMVENEDADTVQATFNDERITKLGRFLRDHFIDELPQFFNVLAGDMSLTGPRPHMVSDNNKYEELIEFYDYRHKVKPGITGLSQVMGYTGETTNLMAMKNRVQLDIFYIRHWSLKLDIKILFHSFRRLIGM
jgi:putative colanic acid biosynthesis UDP-glucose lipid carrier transferase